MAYKINFQIKLLCFFLLPSALVAQDLILPASVEALLKENNLLINRRVLGEYKIVDVEQNDYLTYDFALHSKKENLTIRIYIKPYDELKASAQFPNIEVGRLLATLSDNETNFHMTSREIEQEDLVTKYHADWGMIHFFRPKLGFSGRKHCKMFTLYKEEVATVFLFYLFDDLGNDFLEDRSEILTY